MEIPSKSGKSQEILISCVSGNPVESYLGSWPWTINLKVFCVNTPKCLGSDPTKKSLYFCYIKWRHYGRVSVPLDKVVTRDIKKSTL